MTPRLPDYVHPNGQPWLATPRPVSDASVISGHRGRTGAPQKPMLGPRGHVSFRHVEGNLVSRAGGTPYRMAFPRHAHQVRPDPLPPESRAVRRALIGVLLIVVALAASLVKVS